MRKIILALGVLAVLVFIGCKNKQVSDREPTKNDPIVKPQDKKPPPDPLKVEVDPFEEKKIEVSPEDQLAHDEDFAEGERLKRQAMSAFEVGNVEEGKETAIKAIQSFTDAHTFDTTGITACSIGYMHYQLGQYNKSIEWFETSVNVNAVSKDNDFAYQYWGMSEVSRGNFEKSLDAFYQSVSVNLAPAHKEQVVDEIDNFGNYSWNLGKKNQDNPPTANSYKKYGLSTWLVAYSVDTMNVALTKKIIGAAKELNETALVERYEQKLSRISKE